MRNFLAWIVCTTFEVISFWLLVVPKRTKVVESRPKGSFYKGSCVGSVCARKVSTPLMVFEEGTLDHHRYIKEVLLVAVRYGNKVFSNYWTFQQDGARTYIHHLTQNWCRNHFSPFIEEDRWASNRPDLNLLDYRTRDKLAKRMN